MFDKPQERLFRILPFLYIFFFFSCQNADPASQEAGSKRMAKTGAVIFKDNCQLCHGADGRLGLNGAKDLTLSKLPLNERVNIITHGKNLMTPFGAQLSTAEIDSVAAFTLTLSQAKQDD